MSRPRRSIPPRAPKSSTFCDGCSANLGTAYLFISHDLSTVRFLSHRVAVLYLGKIVEEADSEELFARPLHPYSAGLLASVLLPDPGTQARERDHA